MKYSAIDLHPNHSVVTDEENQKKKRKPFGENRCFP